MTRSGNAQWLRVLVLALGVLLADRVLLAQEEPASDSLDRASHALDGTRSRLFYWEYNSKTNRCSRGEYRSAARDSIAQTYTGQDGRLYRPVVIEHAVKLGDTVGELALRYLGTRSRWPEIAATNRQLSDPSQICPGDVLLIVAGAEDITPRSPPPPPPPVVEEERAAIRAVVNEVQKSRQLTEWQRAQAGEELLSGDGVRTRQSSTAVLTFSSGASLLLQEYSQVFLKAEESESGVTRDRIDIQQGQADLSLDRALEGELAVSAGGTTALPGLDAEGRLQTRARVNEVGRSQWMVYAGVSSLESGGVVVDVPGGMGTSVKKGEAPAPPEALLPAPRRLDSARFAWRPGRTPVLQWEVLEGAEHYLVEICRDEPCLEIAAAHEIRNTESLTGDQLPSGRYFWRLQGVSPSGLDGYLSDSGSFLVWNLRWLSPQVLIPAGTLVLVLLWVLRRRRRSTKA